MRRSMLERMIARLTAQRAWLDLAAVLADGMPGIVLEVGLGKGRTFDHLRARLPDRPIYAFDASLHAPRNCAPSPERLLLGDFRETLPRMLARVGPSVALAHADFGSEDPAHDAAQAASLGPLLDPLMRDGGIVVADRLLHVAGWQPLAAPAGLDWPYWGWRVRGERPGEGSHPAEEIVPPACIFS
ncbi:MAG TPA: class I SAM-dependent methyltransferase [Geminicoccaceae bacterium]|nr:class I SAM-dependent methyltransferase [Geminicoccaceae bacterium]